MSDDTNPWVSSPSQGSAVLTVPPALPPVTGPAAPQEGVPGPDLVDQLPVTQHASNAPLWWLGVHGGAGESTLASLTPQWAAARHAWPKVPWQKSRVVLVARTHVAGLTAARHAARQWASGLVPWVNLLGLVLVADAPGRTPRPIRDLAKLVAGGVPRHWSVAWVEPWRLGEDVSGHAPRQVRRLIEELHTIVESDTTRTTTEG